MSVSKLNPWKARNSCTTSAISSEVRSAWVDSRHVSRMRRSPSSSKSPMTVSVLPASTANNISVDLLHIETDGEHRRRVRDSADRDEVDAGPGVGVDVLQVDAAAHLEQ